MEIKGSFLDALAPWRELWGNGKQRMGTHKLLLSDNSNSDDEENCDTNHEDEYEYDNCVAVLTMSPPDHEWKALCRLDADWLKANRKQQTPNKLQDAPVSLCVTARLKARLQALCSEHPAMEPSTAYRVTFWTLLIAFAILLGWLDRDRTHLLYHLFFLIFFASFIESVRNRVHQTSPEYIRSKKRFNDAVQDSELESSLASLLGRCGYRHVLEEERDGRWKVILYQIEGTEPKLPPVSTTLLEEEAFEKELEEAKKLYQFFHRCHVIKTHHHKDDSPPNQEDGEDPLGPLDFWTFRGLMLGQALNLSENHATSQKVGLYLCSLYVVALSVSLTRAIDQYIFVWFAGIFFGFMVIATISTAVNHIFDKPHRDAADAKLAKALSPLIRDRHGGYSLSYCPSTRKFLCFRNFGTFVLDPPALLEMTPVV